MKLKPMSEEDKKLTINSLQILSYEYQQMEMEQYQKELFEDIALIDFSIWILDKEREGKGFLGYYLERISN